MKAFTRVLGWVVAGLAMFQFAPAAEPALKQIGIDRGICAVLGLPNGGPHSVANLARASQLTVYFQSPRAEQVAAVREATSAAGLLGSRVFAECGPSSAIRLADNLAGAILVDPSAGKVPDVELLRVLHPEGVALVGNRRLVKPHPKGEDPWSHVFHGPDNNTLSTDALARAPYLTQFLADPKFCPMPEVSVAAGGRVFRAFGHIAHKANQNALLNTLLGINGYNGAILWQRPLREGYMIHRNTMIATPELLYLGDDESCKLLDARTGRLTGEIRIPEKLADGPVWKWMGLEGGVLYALVGAQEVHPKTVPSNTPGLGHWPWGMWEGHDYKDPATNFGFGRTVLAVDPKTSKILWSHRQPDYLDARGVCMRKGRIYVYSPGKFVACLDAVAGKLLWKNTDQELLEAIGPDGAAQHYITGYATTTFVKCNDRYLFFAGPQRRRLVVASTLDGKLVWQKEPGNLQLVLRPEAIYAAGAQWTAGQKLDYQTGQTLSTFPARRACTRATGSVDSVFYRAHGGTVRIDVASDKARHIAPMRPPCQDGVIISGGHLYWGPWMCGCELSLYGHIGLGPAGQFNFTPPVDDSRLTGSAGAAAVQPLAVDANDWPTYLADNGRTGVTKVTLPQQAKQTWSVRLPGSVRPTAPIAAGGLVFLGDESGAVYALDPATGSTRWRWFTGAPVFFPPALWQGRLYVGSADGRVYCLEAVSGRLLWTFRAAPAERRIPVYGRLISNWPVAGGVLVSRGVVYAAAGITHYDGTYVYALDATSGRVQWNNDTSGRLSEEVECGVSLQGNLYVSDNELRFLGGGKYEIARFDLSTGRALNEPDNTVASRFRTAFYPYYPDYGRYMSLSHVLPDGRELACDASYEGSQHSALSLFGPLPPDAQRPPKQAARWPLSYRGDWKRKTVWVDKTNRHFTAFVLSPGKLLTAGDDFLTLVDEKTGADVWTEKLPSRPVRAGVAVDHHGRIVVTLENGQVVAFGG